jgi:hypothetical protein
MRSRDITLTKNDSRSSPCEANTLKRARAIHVGMEMDAPLPPAAERNALIYLGTQTHGCPRRRAIHFAKKGRCSLAAPSGKYP